MSAPPSPPRRPGTALVGLLLALALLVAACSENAGSGSPSAGEMASGAERSDEEPRDQGPDPLPDPGVAPGECELVTYTPPTASSAYKGELCRPAENQRDLAVMVVHGGSGVGGSYTGMRSWATRLLAEGYVVFLPAYHLFTPGGRSPVFPLPEQNIKAATQFLRGTANALGTRRDRVVVQGMSAGSRIAAVAYTHPGDDYFADEELWPDIADEVNGFIGFYHTYDGSMQYSSQYYGGEDDSSDKTVRARWDKADSLASAANAVGPALFITGDKDWDLIIDQQERFADTLEDNDIEATTVIIKGGSHGFDSGTTTRLSRLGEQAASAVLRWLNDEFPQDPRRSAESSSADLATAPSYTGSPPPSYDTRKRTSPTVTSPTGTSPSSTTVSTATSTTSTTEAPTTTTTTLEASTTTTVEPTTTTSEAPPDPP